MTAGWGIMRSPALTTSLAALLVAFVAAGCSSADPTPVATKKKTPTTTPTQDPPVKADDAPKPGEVMPTPTGGSEVGTETWANGKTLPAGGVEIKAGATVTIDSGAIVTVGTGDAITIKGSLVVKTGAKHAQLTGMNWKGIYVATGGSLTVDGLDIVNAATAITTQKGNTAASLTNTVITNTGKPFSMEPTSKLTVAKSKVTTTGQSDIAGTFVASFLDYDKGSAEGLELNDPAGTMTISDSVFKGSGSGDYIVSQKGALVKVEYTTISGSHCPFHFNSGLTKYTLDHVATRQNGFGQMFYGDDVGPNTISYGSFEDASFDQTGRTTMLAIDHSYIKAKNTVGAVTITTAATAPVTAAAPRGTPGPT